MKKSAVNKENHRIDFIDINKKEILELIAKRIQQERKRKGFTQQDLADFIDSSANYISEVERGIKEPGITIMYRICVALDISLNELVLGQRMSNGLPNGVIEKLQKLTDEQVQIITMMIDAVDQYNNGMN